MAIQENDKVGCTSHILYQNQFQMDKILKCKRKKPLIKTKLSQMGEASYSMIQYIIRTHKRKLMN